MADLRGVDLWDALTSGPRVSKLHCWAGGRYEAAAWSRVVGDAEEMTVGLRRAGVAPGTCVAAVLTNAPLVVRGILAVWLAGGTLASLPVPARGMDMEEYAEQLKAICGQLDPAVFLLEERMLGALPRDLRESSRARSWESFAGSGRVEPSPPGDDEVAFVQYSSGSTSAPKGCMLTPRAIMAQLELIWAMIEGERASDVGVSWLPLSHDMGLFGLLLTPWVNDCDLYLSTPERFMLSPRTWFGDAAECGATITAATNTGLHIGARAYRTARLSRALRMSVCIVGAERVEWDALQLAAQTLEPFGFAEESLMPAYGLAEATLAVTATPVREAPRHIVVDGVALADGELCVLAAEDPRATQVVSAGVPCGAVELPGAQTDSLAEIRVRSDSLASGYFGEVERTRERFCEGTVLTGDIGFVNDGHLYPVGRVDDVVSVGGRKVYAREIENAVDALDGVRRGCSTLVEHPAGATSRLTMFVELRGTNLDYPSLASEVASLAMAKAAVPLSECVFLAQGSLPKTPSGKIQRHRCRQMADAERFAPLARIDLG